MAGKGLKRAVSAVLILALAGTSVDATLPAATAQSLIPRDGNKVLQYQNGSTPFEVQSAVSPTYVSDAIVSGEIATVGQLTQSQSTIGGRVTGENGAGLSNVLVTLRWIDRDGQLSPAYRARTATLEGQSGFYALSVPDWVDATGRIHSYEGALNQKVRVFAHVNPATSSPLITGYGQTVPYSFVAPRRTASGNARMDISVRNTPALSSTQAAGINEFDSTQLPALPGDTVTALAWSNGNAVPSFSAPGQNPGTQKIGYRWRDETNRRTVKSCSEERTVTNDDGTTSVVQLSQQERNRCVTLQVPSNAKRGDVYAFEILADGVTITHESFVVGGALNERDDFIYGEEQLVSKVRPTTFSGSFRDGFDRAEKKFTVKPGVGIDATVDEDGVLTIQLNDDVSNNTNDQEDVAIDVSFYNSGGTRYASQAFYLDTDGDGNADLYDPDDDGDGVLDSVEITDGSNKKNAISANAVITGDFPVGYHGARYVAQVNGDKMPRNAELELVSDIPGLSYNAAAGVIEGTPTQSGNHAVRMRAVVRNGSTVVPVLGSDGAPIEQEVGTIQVSPASATTTETSTQTATSTVQNSNVLTTTTRRTSTATTTPRVTLTASGPTVTTQATTTSVVTPPRTTVSTTPPGTTFWQAPETVTLTPVPVTSTVTATRTSGVTVTETMTLGDVTTTRTAVRTMTVTPELATITSTRRTTETATADVTRTAHVTDTSTITDTASSITTVTSTQTEFDRPVVRAGEQTSIEVPGTQVAPSANTPDWVSAQPDGRIDLAPPRDTPAGDYNVEVVTPDGRPAVVPVRVAPAPTSSERAVVRAGEQTSVKSAQTAPTQGEAFTPGKNTPEWVTVNPSGQIDFKPPRDVEPGEYKVEVVDPAGETSTVTVEVTAAVSDAERYTVRYDFALGRRGHEATSFAPLFDVTEGGYRYLNQIAPAGTTYEVVGGDATVDRHGRVTFAIPGDAAVGDVIETRIRVIFPDGSSVEVPAKFEVAEQTLADAASPRYLDGVKAGPGERVSVPQVGEADAAEFYLKPGQDLKGWEVIVDPLTGEVHTTAPATDAQALDVEVMAVFSDGSRKPVKLRVDVGEAAAAETEPAFAEQVAGPGETVRIPQTKTMPEGTFFDIADDGGLEAAIDPVTGELTVRLPDDAPADATYVIGVKTTYPDGTVEIVPVKIGTDSIGRAAAVKYPSASSDQTSGTVTATPTGVPDGSTFALDPAFKDADWVVSVNKNTGEITATLRTGIVGERSTVVPVRVTFPDGSVRAVPVEITAKRVAEQPAADARSARSSEGPWWIIVLVALLGVLGIGWAATEYQDQIRHYIPQFPVLPRL